MPRTATVLPCSESAEVRPQLKGELGGREISMLRLQDWLVEALNRENLTITAAVSSIPLSAFSIVKDFSHGSGSFTARLNLPPIFYCPRNNANPEHRSARFR